jgi:hypothetical protein
MNWREIHTKLVAKKDKNVCLDFAIACADKSAPFTNSELVLSTLPILKNNRWIYGAVKDKFTPLAVERVSHKDDLNKREAAHIMLHAVEIASVNSLQSQAGHAARCGEALSRIDEGLVNELILEFNL